MLSLAFDGTKILFRSLPRSNPSSKTSCAAMLAVDPGLAKLERMASARLQPSRRVLLDGSFSTDFTCRGHAMHNLTAEQARLAHSGRIGARLRRNSPVYYWQTTPQRRSRHEALCKKDSRWHLTTFGSHGKFEEKAKAKCASVNRLKHRVVDSCTALSLADLPAEWVKQHGIVVGTRGVGFWRWKAFTILQRLSSMADGEVLVHADYDLLMAPPPYTDDLSTLFCLGANAPLGVATFHFPCFTDRAWTKAEAAEALNATDAQRARSESARRRRAPARLLRHLRACLTAPGSPTLSGRSRPTGRPANASGARASRLQSRRFCRSCRLSLAHP